MTPAHRRPARQPETRENTIGHASGQARDTGQVTAFITVVIAGLLLAAGLVLDGGLALTAKVRAINEAQEAARAAAGQIDLTTFRETGQLTLDPAAAQTAAVTYLAATGNPDAATAIVTITGDEVTVTVARTQPTQLLALAGVAALTVHGTARAVAAYGVEAPE